MTQVWAAAAATPGRAGQRGALFEVLLDRPKKLNSLNLPMVREVAAALDAAEWAAASDDGCLALAMTGAGGKAFCAGGDAGRGVWFLPRR